MTYDVIVIGAGLAGLVATAELSDQGKKVLLLIKSQKLLLAVKLGGLLVDYFLLIHRNKGDLV